MFSRIFIFLLVFLLLASFIQFWFYIIVEYLEKEFEEGIEIIPQNIDTFRQYVVHSIEEPSNFQIKQKDQSLLHPHLPPLPPFVSISNAKQLAKDTLEGKPTIAGISVILTNFLKDLHFMFQTHANKKSGREEVIRSYVDLTRKYLIPLDTPYRGKPMFPIRNDDSVFISIASFRDDLLGNTLMEAFSKATHPDKLFVGTIVQNCFGVDYTCKTGAQVIGKNKLGHDQTKVSDASPDVNGVAEFCKHNLYRKYCDTGQLRVLYVNETESIGPAVARYYASKLWGGETYYVQVDSHLHFANDWDSLYIEELHLARSYPNAVLSAYPPGFDETVPIGNSTGTRLCSCEFSTSNVEFNIIRINTAGSTPWNAPRPTQIAYIAAGFFFTRSEFLVDVPFDPLLPWCFMGEEISLSMRAWTSGWDIYAPRKNLISHQYRPGRMGLPKFWGTVGRVFNKPGPHFNTLLQEIIITRIKHLVGYPEATLERIMEDDNLIVLTEFEHYALGNVRTRNQYLDFVKIDVNKKECSSISWCMKGEYE